ncbi:hypothetical protein [Helicobacter macacae]|uniref:hypothetical protein n=1 Tax=Helicobacter macacae TaxID=398626 RepID=UPI00041021D8|nr:hypothetical protein [Helicobacter macacae]
MAESRIAKRKKAAPSPLPRPKKKTLPLFLFWLGGVPRVFYFALELSLALCKRAKPQIFPPPLRRGLGGGWISVITKETTALPCFASKSQDLRGNLFLFLWIATNAKAILAMTA